MTELFALGRDVELRHAGQNNTPVCNLSLAYAYGQKDPQTGKRPTQWIDASLWGKRAEALAPYLTKATKVVATIEGLHQENYQSGERSGVKLVGEIIAITLAGSPQAAAPQAPPPAPRPAPRPAAPPARTGFDDMDDDIPFASPHVEHDPIHGHRKALRARAAR